MPPFKAISGVESEGGEAHLEGENTTLRDNTPKDLPAQNSISLGASQDENRNG